MTAERRKATEAEANALASGIRLRIIRLTFTEALTNKELAQRLGRDPATTLHHVRKLVDTGFLRALPARKGTRGAREIPYLSTGLSWELDDAGVTPGVSEAVLEAYLAEVAEVGPDALRQSRLVLQLHPAEHAEFERRLYDLLEEFKNRSPQPGEPSVAVYTVLYPSR
ncbi:Helix-turn-helix domain-containing protein [Amycolatopsis marina]|uniref:Helix-turn-helix domain-containing protein n=1 Tax=Amycolatopsis marina TaxID=490629 RepID=A0A1I1AIL0_9PSEU|nr:helix-turn-helix domain-containing protein [Amycolatopsis marina]SFB37777.1 Helix-turn-helix domain-containing protein [Amycolatopsis marina]